MGPGLPLSRCPEATFYHPSGERSRLWRAPKFHIRLRISAHTGSQMCSVCLRWGSTITTSEFPVLAIWGCTLTPHSSPPPHPPQPAKCCPSSQERRRKGCCEGKDSNQPVGKVILPPLSSQAGGCPNELWKAGHHTGSLRQPCLPNPFWPVPAAAPPAVLSDVPTLTETSQQPHSPPHRLHQGCSHLLIPCDLTKSQGAGK